MAKKKVNNNRKNILIALVLLTVVILMGFLFTKSLNWQKSNINLAKTYTGVLPCADCSGLQTTLTLVRKKSQAKYGTFVLHEIYEGKGMQPIVSEGEWKLSTGTPDDPQAKVLTLKQFNSNDATYYLVDSAGLHLLDQNKQKINSPFNETLTPLRKDNQNKKKTSTLANPASENCVEKGGMLVIKTRGDGGQYGLCQFEDQACEEWALFRGECPVGGVKTTGFDNIEQQYCAWLGGQTLAEPNASCNLPNGKVCSDESLYNGRCEQ